MPEQSPSHRGGVHSRRRRVLRIGAVVLAVLVLVGVVGGFVVYRQLESNITEIHVADALGSDRPDKVVPPKAETEETPEPLNILLLGSDTRQGQGVGIGGDTPGLSDTTILLHLSADRQRAYGVSIPRDAMVQRPSCQLDDGSTSAGGLEMFNSAYAVGGPACTIRTVEAITDIRIDHFAVLDFRGFTEMVDAIDGVPVCVPEEVDDDIGNIYLRAGSYEVRGRQALNYVRLRHELSENGDIGRMKRQQAFLAAMANKAISAGTLARPVRLYKFLDAATASLSTDPGLASLRELGGLAKQLRDIGLENIQFLTVPFRPYPPDINRLQIAPGAEELWDRLRRDQSLTATQERQVTTAAEEPGGSEGSGGDDGRGTAPSSGTKGFETDANGLCA